MECYKNKSKKDLLAIIEHLEKQLQLIKNEHESDDSMLYDKNEMFERIRAYEELKILKCALRNAQEGILATKPDGQLYFANERIVTEFGLIGDIRSYNIRDIVNDDLYAIWSNITVDVHHKDSKMRYVFPKSPDNPEEGIYEIFANVLLDESGEAVLWCFVRDITIRVKQQNEITRLHYMLNSVLNNIPIYLFVKDVNDDFRYLYWNKAFAIHTGVAAEEAIGLNDFELFGHTELMERFHREDLLLLEKGRLEYEEETVTARGEKRIMITIKNAIFPDPKTPYIVGLSWDVTDIRNAEKEIIEARLKAEEADKLKSSFLANMSHEIRTPLNAIVGFSKLAIDSKNEEEKWHYVDVVDKNSQLLLNLFNDILDLSAIESDSLILIPRRVILRDLCCDQYELHRHTVRHGVKFILDDTDNELWINADWSRLGQVVSNLLDNAIKFTHKGEIHFGYELKGDMVQFYVKDTGIGISSDKISNIFRRFGKVDNFVQGTGLGLAISRLLVEKMGGRIWVRSNFGVGTTFYFTIPYNQSV